MSNGKPKDLAEDTQLIVEEKIVKVGGETTVRKYSKGRFLGKGGFAKCYEFINLETKKLCAAKVIDKATLTKNRAKQKALLMTGGFLMNIKIANVRNSYSPIIAPCQRCGL